MSNNPPAWNQQHWMDRLIQLRSVGPNSDVRVWDAKTGEYIKTYPDPMFTTDKKGFVIVKEQKVTSGGGS